MNNPLPIARYRFTFAVTETLRLQEYAGSMLRGAFGQALRSVACMTRAAECRGCPLLASCPYSRIFAPHDIPRPEGAFATIREIPVPYIIEAPLDGARVMEVGGHFSFCMVLFGKAIEELPIITLAWQRAFGRGLGREGGTGDLLQVEHQTASGWQQILHADAPVLQPHNATITLPQPGERRDFHLQLATPLRLQKEKKILGPRDIAAPLFLRNLLRRVSFVGQLYLGFDLSAEIHQLNALADHVQDERRLVWKEWARYSSRQQQKMDLGGVTGRWLLKDVPAELQSFVYLGQWVHVGKETMFGLGGYRIVDDAWNPLNREKRE